MADASKKQETINEINACIDLATELNIPYIRVKAYDFEDMDYIYNVIGEILPKAEENDTTASTPDISDTNTDKPTDATDKPTDATESEKDDSTETEKKNGCGSSAALSAIVTVGMIGTAIVLKKKEDK